MTEQRPDTDERDDPGGTPSPGPDDLTAKPVTPGSPDETTQPTAAQLPSTGAGDSWYYAAPADNTFAGAYARWNPREDMATTWECFFLDRYHGTTLEMTVIGPKHWVVALICIDLQLRG